MVIQRIPRAPRFRIDASGWITLGAIAIALALAILSCASPGRYRPLDLDYHAEAILEITKRHDALLDAVEALDKAGLTSQLAPQFSGPDLAISLRVWRAESSLLELAVLESATDAISVEPTAR